MPYKVTTVDNGKGLLQIGSGKLTGQEIYNAIHIALNDTDLIKTIQYGLVDFSLVTDVDISSSDVRRVASLAQSGLDIVPKQWIVFVTQNPLLFGLSRMYAEYSAATNWEFRVLATLEEAKAFLREHVDPDLTFGETEGSHVQHSD